MLESIKQTLFKLRLRREELKMKAIVEESSLLGCGVLTDVSEERRLTPLLHGATSQKTAFFIVTTVKTSNLTKQ
jgi:hypothetical protein